MDHYYDNCVYDSCGCNRGGDCECMCTAVADYVSACNRMGVHIKWRGPGNCRTYAPSRGHYINRTPSTEIINPSLKGLCSTLGL